MRTTVPTRRVLGRTLARALAPEELTAVSGGHGEDTGGGGACPPGYVLSQTDPTQIEAVCDNPDDPDDDTLI